VVFCQVVLARRMWADEQYMLEDFGGKHISLSANVTMKSAICCLMLDIKL